jgi:hypothetical protein
LLPQISQLNALITLLIGNLSAGDRMKIMTICTIDVHARDVVAKMITAKAWVPGGARNQGGGLGLRTPAHIPHPSHCFFLSGAGGHFSRQRLPRSAPLISPLVSHWTSSPIRSAPGSAVGAVLGLMGAPGEGRAAAGGLPGAAGTLGRLCGAGSALGPTDGVPGCRHRRAPLPQALSALGASPGHSPPNTHSP